MTIRPFQPQDLHHLRALTVEVFDGVSIDQSIEKRFGLLAGRDWRWRKALQVDEDCAANPAGVFVADEDGVVLGYISTRVDRATGKGRIPNLAVAPAAQGRGLGRRLVEHALEYFRREGLTCAMIETMENNPVGQHLYPSCGFVEAGRQIQYALKL